VIGYYNLGIHDYSVMHLDFSHSKVQIEWHYQEAMNMDGSCSNICDASGNAILWTNGMCIYRKGGISIVDSIAYKTGPEYWNLFDDVEFGPLGFPEHDGSIILPMPSHVGEYLAVYYSAETDPIEAFLTSRYLSTRIKYDTDNSYTLIYKDSLLGSRILSYTTTLCSVRHANGRDWWVINFKSNSQNYFSNLVDPNGIHLDHIGAVDISVKEGTGNCIFSKNGNYIARVDAVSLNEGQFLTIYSFDRCNGDLTRLTTIHMPQYSFYGGAAFSPSERYVYADDNSHLWQWDLWASDIVSSQTLIDTFDGFIQPGWFAMDFGPLVEGPDDRIYVIPPKASSEFIHVIDRPDLKGKDCRFLQHYINLTKPNGRLLQIFLTID